MDDNELYFEAMKNMELEARDDIGGKEFNNKEFDSKEFNNKEFDSKEFDNEDLEEHLDPNLFYLACQKALVRLKTFAASNPSF